MRPTAALLVLVGLALSSCGPPRSGTADVLNIVDDLDRKVAVPSRVERVLSLEPELTRIIVALGAEDRLVGIDFFLRHQDHLFPLICPRAASLPVVSNQGQELHYELAYRLDPDIIFSSPSEFRMTEAIERKMRRPVAALASRGRFEALLHEIGLLGRILGREERAAEILDFFRHHLAALREANERDEDRRLGPTVYLSFWGSLIRTPVAYEPVDAAGGRNLASGLLPAALGDAGTTIPVEQILLWDPEVILIQGNYPPGERLVTVEGLLEDPRFSSLRAVRGGRVHYTFGYWYWWDPALVLVETLYLSRLFAPGRPSGPDLLEEGDRIFEFFYRSKGAFSALCRTLECHEWFTH